MNKNLDSSIQSIIENGAVIIGLLFTQNKNNKVENIKVNVFVYSVND